MTMVGGNGSIAARPVRGSRPGRALEAARAFAIARPVLAVLMVALAARVIVALVVFAGFDGGLFGDDQRYSAIAAGMADGNFQALSPYWGPQDYLNQLYDDTETVLLPIASLYWLFGPITLLGQLFVAALGAGAAAVTTRLAMELMPRAVAIGAGLVVALLPSQVIFSSIILKDAGIWLTMALLALVIARASVARGEALAGWALATVGLLFALGHLRGHTLVIACWALALTALLGSRQQWLPRAGGALLIALVMPMTFGFGPAGIHNLRGGALSDLGFQRAANAMDAQTAISTPKPVPASPTVGAPVIVAGTP
ncbi:MAG: hypothetical protein JWM73_3067, partial [Solirubrobacterales bacterium]|nr:hypothetical protein [Solirubrobacterales bacterium]